MDWEMTLRNEREKGREMERANTEEHRKRAEAAELQLNEAEAEIRRLKALLEDMQKK